MSDLLTTMDAAAILGWKPITVSVAVSCRGLRPVNRTEATWREWLFTRDEVERYRLQRDAGNRARGIGVLGWGNAIERRCA